MEVLVDTVKVELPEPATDVGLNVGVAPVGRPLALKATLPVNPAIADMLVVCVVLPPRATVCEMGVADIEKFGLSVRFATAVPFLVASMVLAAVTVTLCAAVTGFGAVYRPVALIVPTLGLIDQVTPLFTPPVTCAVYC